jgi:hypothetical protein
VPTETKNGIVSDGILTNLVAMRIIPPAQRIGVTVA